VVATKFAANSVRQAGIRIPRPPDGGHKSREQSRAAQRIEHGTDVCVTEWMREQNHSVSRFVMNCDTYRSNRYIVRAFRDQIMASIRGLLKPCYLYSPRTAFRRVFMELFPPKTGVAVVSLPWKISLEVDLSDAIGKENFKQRSFDIAVS